MNDNSGSFMGLLLITVFSLGIYFIPTVVAVNRKHIQTTPIILLNIFLGWTLLGWVVALIWASLRENAAAIPAARTAVPITPEPERSSVSSGHEEDAAAIERFAKLLDDGMITREEFEAKKRIILGI